MPQQKNLEFKVGFFVLVALASLSVFIFSISDSSVFEEGRNYRVVFQYADGLRKNAPVRVAGVDEGIVEDIGIYFDREIGSTKVEVEIRLGKNTKIPADSTILINQLGLLGEKYIEILPGVDRKNFLQQGQTIPGKDPIPQAFVSEKVIEVANKLDSSIGGFNEIITNENNISSIEETLQNLAGMSGSLKDILHDVEQGKGTIGKLLYDEQLYDNLQDMTADLKENPWKLLYRPKDNKKKR